MGQNLRGHRTTYSLPNLPNFNLPPLVAQVAEAGPQPPIICPGDSVRIGYPDSTNGAVTYHWHPTNGIADANSAYTWAKPDTTTWYYLTALDTAMGAPCGETIDSVLVRVAAGSDLPVPNLGNDTTVCFADTVRVGSVSATSGWLYAWSGGGYIQSPDSALTLVSGAGAYSVTVTNPASNLHCFTASDTLVISNYPAIPSLPAQVAGDDTVICVGDSVVLGMLGVPGWDYLWSPAGFLNAANLAMPIAQPLVTTAYVLTVADSASGGACGLVQDTVSVTVEQPFAHDAPSDVRFCVGECFTIGVPPVSGMSYAWSPTTGLTSPNASLTKAQPSATTVYTLTVTNPAMQSFHCREREFSVTARADGCNHQSFIAVNGDGVAETLDLGDHAGRVELRVFDMAGRYVFRSMDYRNDWSAAELARGVYVYRVSVVGDCPSDFVGKIVVLR